MTLRFNVIEAFVDLLAVILLLAAPERHKQLSNRESMMVFKILAEFVKIFLQKYIKRRKKLHRQAKNYKKKQTLQPQWQNSMRLLFHFHPNNRFIASRLAF